MASFGSTGVSAGLAARRLLRAARSGMLATLGTKPDGAQPFASLVTPAIAGDGGVLLLLSELAEHTRHLRAGPRCSLLVTGPPTSANPQTTPRVTITGTAAVSDSAADRARFLAVHPYAGLYADFGDFHIWRIVPQGGLLVGGFARASRLGADDLAPDAAAAAAIAALEPSFLPHCNIRHAASLAAIGGGGAWRIVAFDPDGCDLALDATTRRIDFAAPVSDLRQVRNELARLARTARQNAGTRNAPLDRPAVSP